MHQQWHIKYVAFLFYWVLVHQCWPIVKTSAWIPFHWSFDRYKWEIIFLNSRHIIPHSFGPDSGPSITGGKSSTLTRYIINPYTKRETGYSLLLFDHTDYISKSQHGAANKYFRKHYSYRFLSMNTTTSICVIITITTR